MVSAVRAAIIVALRLRAERWAIILGLWVQERFDGRHHRLGDQHHLQPECPGNVDQCRGPRCRRTRLDVTVALPRITGEIRYLLLRDSGRLPGAAKMVADRSQSFCFHLHVMPLQIISVILIWIRIMLYEKCQECDLQTYHYHYQWIV
jgi:hypothetical protein